MIKTLVLIRDVLMYAGMLIGMFLIGYVRVSFSERQKKSPQVALDYNDKERKLRKAGLLPSCLLRIGKHDKELPQGFLCYRRRTRNPAQSFFIKLRLRQPCLQEQNNHKSQE